MRTDSEFHERLKELDQLSQQIKEREHEETRQEIEELYRRINRRKKAPENGG